MTNIIKPPSDEGVIQNLNHSTDYQKETQRWVLVATILGSSMAFIDGTVVNIALPILQSDLNATTGEVQWVVESYALILAALVLVGGSLGDFLGRRRIFAIGIGLFALASLACGFATTPLFLILAQAVQGIGAALLVPNSLAIISANFDGATRGRAIGTWSGFTTITAALGPVLGGWLIQNISWRAAFFINLPISLLVLFILWWRVPENPRQDTKLDWWGAGLATVGLGTLVYGLIEAGSQGFGNPVIILTLIASVVILTAFVIVERRSRSPMLPLGLFRSRTFSGANLLTLLLYAALSINMFYLPFNLIQVQGYSTTAAGAAFLPFIIIMFTLSRWAGGLVSRFGSRIPLVVGPTIAAAGLFLFSLPGKNTDYWTSFFPAIVILALGMSVSVAPLTTTVMGSVDNSHAGIASGINNAVARTAGLLAIAVLGIIVLSSFNASLDSRLTGLELPSQVRLELDQQRVKLAGAEIKVSSNPQLQTKLKDSITDSFIESYRIAAYIAAGLALASAIAAGLLIESKKQSAKEKDKNVESMYSSGSDK